VGAWILRGNFYFGSRFQKGLYLFDFLGTFQHETPERGFQGQMFFKAQKTLKLWDCDFLYQMTRVNVSRPCEEQASFKYSAWTQ
jgi:hypothetical protein